VDREPRGLVDDDEMVVLVANADCDRLRFDRARRRGELYFDDRAALDSVALGAYRTVYANGPLVEEPFRERA
jgi:hypothetical protein